jgi:hypothetical protein
MSKKEYVRLSDDWLTEGLIDLEYKKYKLLAFLQNVDERFMNRSLYPPFSDVIFHYKNLLRFRDSNDTLIRNFPRKIKSIDLNKLALEYEKSFDDPEFMEELNRIIEFALPQLSAKMKAGKEIYDEIEDQIKLEPIGLCPINQSEGYLLLNTSQDRFMHVFEYQITIFKSANAKYRGINTTYLEKVRKSISKTFEAVKIDLIKRYKKLPNPATFIVESGIPAPMNETLLPISKRMLIQRISA